MAKLEGVKTLDMVNGEITKVAYDGAEYVKTDTAVQEGDLFLLTEGHSIISGESGEFYLTEKYRNGAIVIPTRYFGNATATQSDGDGIAFRKVSACTDPSLEERVSSAEGEIESLKSDVAALKGETEYERIDADEAKVGDFVKFDDPPDYLTDEEYYEIDRFDSSGDPWITDDDGDECDASNRDFEVYRKVSAASVEAERLKVGDYARVVDLGENGIRFGGSVGDVVKVADVRKNQIRTEELDGGDYNGNPWAEPRQLVRATDEEVAEAKDAAAARAKFKEGAKVRLKSGGGDYPLGGFTDGNIYEVSDNAYNHRRGTLIRIESGDCFRGSGFAAPDQLEILTEEKAAEIERQQAEEAKWAKIGRKVGEYKKGDIARVVDNQCAGRVANGDIIEVLKQASGGSVVDTVHGYFLKVELITPVEARFDR
ncbi:hypothetical protein [Bacillus amyloliquefaciens]|uniref:hypothetical protein n=1 Tax=Bacillus amyloliquefaciens TaxID=1390 RepID=UPI00266E9ACF|nr:hypothetical protein [Bacillus amyloliquefaciens]WKT37439.1 hypothetical protein Q2B68_07185 [Bacillus amyloliquefaciens]WKT37530.1 hypothetical protein Q2B68_07655 [Bacillus amyloliquefaciens]